MKALVLAALACLSALPMAAQNNQAVQVAVDPAGACGFPQSLRYNYVNGKLWGCVNGTWAQISGGVGGTGNAANEVAVAFSATPTFTCGSASAGTATHFTVAALTGNITSSTLASCTAGQTIGLHFVQDGIGGWGVTMPTNWDSLTIDATASTATEASYWYDGVNGRLVSVNGKATPFLIGQAPERAAPTTAVSCGSSAGCMWFDSTSHKPSFKANNSPTVWIPVDSLLALTQTIASGQTAIPTSALAGNTCDAAATTATATGAATTDAPVVAYASDPTGVTGYGGGTSGGITIRAWATANTFNFKRCNETGLSITPGALNINWRIPR